MNRRNFVRNVTATACLSAVSGLSFGSQASAPSLNMTIQQVIDLILKDIPGAPFPSTVDTIKAGDANQAVTGIITSMFATVDVIQQAAKAGANFIIAHEPTFYSHTDDTKWLENNSVFQYKKALLGKHAITVWRCHDYIHAHKPDGVLAGVLAALGWQGYADAVKPNLLKIPPQSLASIIDHTKNKLAITHVRYVGKLDNLCSRIAIIPGAAGGKTQINVCNTEKPDLLIVGEVSEWETLEYFRDLQASGSNSCLLILNHIPSEEPGMEWLASWLKDKIKPVMVKHIPAGSITGWA